MTTSGRQCRGSIHCLPVLQQGQGTAGRILKDEALYQDVRASVQELQKLVADLNAGKGTAGKLLKSEELHDQIQRLDRQGRPV